MNVAVRPAGPADSELIARWLSDPQVCRYLTSNLREARMTPALVRAGLRRADQSWHVIETDGRPVGLVAFDNIDPRDGVANLWYAVAEPGFAGRGVATAAVLRVLADNPLELATVTAWVGEPNAASARVLEKAGFRRVGRVTAGFKVDDERFDRLLFEKVLVGA